MTLSSAVRQAMIGAPECIQPDICKAVFHFSESFPGFDGHFPGNPLLPGIAQILSVALAVHPDGPARIRKIRRTKFLSMVRPGETMTVEARLRAATAPDEGQNTEERMVSAACSTPNGICAHIELTMDLASNLTPTGDKGTP